MIKMKEYKKGYINFENGTEFMPYGKTAPKFGKRYTAKTDILTEEQIRRIIREEIERHKRNNRE